MRIGVVAPARPIDPLVAAKTRAFAALAYPEVELFFHPQCFAEDGHFAGSDEVRAQAFLDVANDPGFDAVWFARGGYGSNRILSHVMPALEAPAARKTYLGYSDMGFLLGALYARRIGQPVHGPMPSEINRSDEAHCLDRALSWIVRRDASVLEPGLDGRPSVAFNLSILDALIGTQWLPDLTDHVLIVEEISEPMYRIDRMFFTLGDATQLKGIAGVRLGMVKDVPVNDPPWNGSVEAMAERWCASLGVPYLGRAQVGHDEANRVVPFGIA